jgi:hypothetical protein
VPCQCFFKGPFEANGCSWPISISPQPSLQVAASAATLQHHYVHETNITSASRRHQRPPTPNGPGRRLPFYFPASPASTRTTFDERAIHRRIPAPPTPAPRQSWRSLEKGWQHTYMQILHHYDSTHVEVIERCYRCRARPMQGPFDKRHKQASYPH